MVTNDGVFAKYGLSKTARRFGAKEARKRPGCGHQFVGLGGKTAFLMRRYLRRVRGATTAGN